MLIFYVLEACKTCSPAPRTTAEPTERGICFFRADEPSKMYVDKQNV